jgi:hypothetical protein
MAAEIKRLKVELSIQAGKSQQLEKELGVAREETQAVRLETKFQKEQSDRTFEEQKEITRLAREGQRKAETELAAFPELSRQAETMTLLLEALAKAQERERWFADRYEVFAMSVIKEGSEAEVAMQT